MRLVADWRKAWRWHSTQLLAVIAALPLVWMQLPPDVKALVPESWMPYIVPVIAVGALVGRLRDQDDAS